VRLRLWTIALSSAGVLVLLHLGWLVQPQMPGSTFDVGGDPTSGLTNLFSGSFLPIRGTGTATGTAASLLAAAPALLALLAVRSPALERIACAAAAATVYCLAACAIEVPSLRRTWQPVAGGIDLGVAFWASIAFAAVLAIACVPRLAELRPHARAVPLLLALLLLPGALLLPWDTGIPELYRVRGVATFPGTLAGALAILALAGLRRRSFGAAAAVLGGGTFAVCADASGAVDGAAWAGLAASVAIAAVLIAGLLTSPRQRLDIPVLAGAGALVVGLFLPWTAFCANGACVSSNGWAGSASWAIAPVALAAAFDVLPLGETAAVAALLGTSAGFQLTLPGEHVRAGAIVSFLGVAALLATAVVRALRGPVRVVRPLAVAPAVICLVPIGLLTVPRWGVLPERLGHELTLGRLSWASLASLVVSFVVAGRWLRVAGASSGDGTVWLSFALLAAAVLTVADSLSWKLTWGAGACLAAASALLATALAETVVGLEQLEVPEILRIDRI
jgi:hypothetical protein